MNAFRRVLVALFVIGVMLAMPRQMARAAVTFSIAIRDPMNIGTAYHEALQRSLLAAASTWAQHFDGDAVIQIELSFDRVTNVLMYAGAGTSVFQRQSGPYQIYDWGTSHEIRTGSDPNGAAVDATVTVNPDFFTMFYFDPDPAAVGGRVPSDKYDAYSVFLHELGHVFAFNGWLEGNADSASGVPPLEPGECPIPPLRAQRVYTCRGLDGIHCASPGPPMPSRLTPPSNYMSVYDSLVNNHTDGRVTFDGANALSLVPGGIPLDPSSYAHLNDSSKTMFTYAFPGVRESLSETELAVLKDCGITMRSAVDPCSVDTDGDGSNDCVDACPQDAAKTAAGGCGCGVPDADSDADGVLDCLDGCPFNPAMTALGPCGCQACPSTDSNPGTGSNTETGGGSVTNTTTDSGGNMTDGSTAGEADEQVLGERPELPVPAGAPGCGAGVVSAAAMLLAALAILRPRKRIM